VNKGKTFPSFRMLLAVRHADSLAKFICVSQRTAHLPPWNAEPWNRSTDKILSV
jgi:hypothetical protein